MELKYVYLGVSLVFRCTLKIEKVG